MQDFRFATRTLARRPKSHGIIYLEGNIVGWNVDLLQQCLTSVMQQTFVTGVVRTSSDVSKELDSLKISQGDASLSLLTTKVPLDWSAVSARSLQEHFEQQQKYVYHVCAQVIATKVRNLWNLSQKFKLGTSYLQVYAVFLRQPRVYSAGSFLQGGIRYWRVLQYCQMSGNLASIQITSAASQYL